MTALIALEFKVAFFQSLDDEEFSVIPLMIVFVEESSERLLTRPFDTNPL